MRVGLAERQFPFVAHLSESARRELDAYAARRVAARKCLLERGAQVEGAYLITGGSLRVFYVTAGGREATLYRVEPGGTCILALTSTFNREPYPAWVESGDRGASFVVVPQDVFRRLFDGEGPFREFIFGVLSSRIFELMTALEEAGSARMDERVAKYLLKNAGHDLIVRASQTEIASELGTAREVVFRALRSLAARNVIRTSRERIVILNATELRQHRSGT